MRVLLKALFLLAFLAASMPTAAGKARLGFTVHYTVKNATAFDAKLDRVVVTKVRESSPAMRAGLMPGDVIELLNGSVVSGASARKLDKEMNAIQAGDVLKMSVLRSGKKSGVLNAIGAMFQFQGGVSDQDKEAIVKELIRRKVLTIDASDRVTFSIA